MKAFSKVNNSRAMFLVVLTCVILAGSISAFATPTAQVHRSTSPTTVTGPCCKNISGESVTVTEPAVIAPVIIEWSMEYVSSGPFAIGLSINGGGCGDYGPEYLPTETAVTGTPFFVTNIQWIVLPGDGLVKGKNTFVVCEGPSVNNADTMTLGTRTLSVQISK